MTFEASLKYYGIFANLAYREYDSVESAKKNSDYIVVKEAHGYYENRVGKDTWKNATTEYEIFCLKNGVVREGIEVNKWKLLYHGSYHYNGNYSKTGVEFKIIDPLGEIALKRFGTGIEGIIEGLRLFLDYSAEKSLRYVELIEENRLLKMELTRLTGRNNDE